MTQTTTAYLNAPHISEKDDDPRLRFRVACVVSRGRLHLFQYKLTGVQVQDVRCFGYSPDNVASFELTKKGEVSMRRQNVSDHLFDIAFRLCDVWRSAGYPAEWVYQEFPEYMTLRAAR